LQNYFETFHRLSIVEKPVVLSTLTQILRLTIKDHKEKGGTYCLAAFLQSYEGLLVLKGIIECTA
jgi:hypothetical protein